ncbi:O-antigen ligase family protein [Patescibacteria group bacterium]|nr:O-antigen ligase family protein [Patescibacteria group bacterium]
MNALIKWSSFFCTTLLIAATLKNRQDVIVVIKATTIAVSIICLYGLVKYFCGAIKFYVNPFSFATKNSLSNWTVGVYPFALAFLFIFAKRKKQKIFWVIIFIIISSAQILTVSRFAWLIMATSIVCIFLLSKNKKHIIFTLILLVACLSYGINSNPSTINKIKERISGIFVKDELMNDGSLSGRSTQIKKTIIIFQKKPLLGISSGRYVNYKNNNPQIEKRFDLLDTHCIYLTLLSELGLSGFIVIILMITLIINSLNKYRLAKKEIEEDKYASIFLLSVVMILVRGLTSHEVLFMPTTALVLGLSIKLSNIENKKNE